MAVLSRRWLALATLGLTLLGLGARLSQHAARGPAAAPTHGERRTTPQPSFSMAPTVDPAAPLPAERPRRVLAIYDSSETVQDEDEHGRPVAVPLSPETTLLHTLAELPLSHLGLVPDFLDVHTAPLPSDDEMARYRGVLTWFGDQRMRHPAAYLTWLIRQGAAGRRLVVLERLGALTDLAGKDTPSELLEQAMAALGGRSLGQPTDDPSRIQVAMAAPGFMGFEGPLPTRRWSYAKFRADPGSAVYLRLQRTDLRESVSDVVWTGPSGGFAHEQTVFREDELGERAVIRWVLDPFRFFAAAFAVEAWPRPDFTTLNGERIFYSHIDGDGLDTLTELDYKSRCGEIIRDRLLRRYDLPFTASVVVGLTAPPPIGRGSEVDVAVARSIFALDNVEIGSHGLAHPLNWRDKREENLSVRGLPGYAFTDDVEIARSVEYIDRALAPPGKRCQIMLWTGWCNPSEGQLAAAYRLGLRNLNGGDPRMDAHYPSYAHLVAPIHRVGGLYQYYTSAANDYILTARWSPPYYRFQNVIQTFERTAAPRRVVPINVYFHFYIARNHEALVGIERIFEWVSRQPIAPRFASEYVDLVRDAHWARLAEPAPGRWVLRKGPALRTARFDDPAVHVDLARSRGVIGYLNHPELGVTYVHLTADPEVTIQLAGQAPRAPYLERATHDVDALQIGGDEIRFTTRGVGGKRFVLRNLPPGRGYDVTAAEKVTQARVGPGGDLELLLPGGGAGAMTVLARAHRAMGID